MKRARILLADDHDLILEGIRGVLEPQYEIVGTVTNGRALFEAAVRLKPDLIALDITMPMLNGIDAAVQIRKSCPQVKLLFVTKHVDSPYLEAALAAGGMGYVLKSVGRDELMEAVDTVLNGRVHLPSRVSNDHLMRYGKPERAATALRLSPREREILQLIAEGKIAREIGRILKISQKTVAFHRDNIKRKLGVKTTAALTRHAIEQGWV